MTVQLFCGDCLEIMPTLADKSIDAVICDPPYGTTSCAWDSVIPFVPMWEQLKRVIKPNGAIVFFGAEPFSSLLRCSNLPWFKYDWIYKKDKPTGHLNAKIQPMRQTEIISVFYENQCYYCPQIIKKRAENIRPATTVRKNTGVYGSMDAQSVRGIAVDEQYPKNILEFISCVENGDKGLHPTQKPVELLKYLIKTYTTNNQIILDFSAGSGTTGAAAVELDRNCILIEKDPQYFDIAKERIAEAERRKNNEFFVKKPTESTLFDFMLEGKQ